MAGRHVEQEGTVPVRVLPQRARVHRNPPRSRAAGARAATTARRSTASARPLWPPIGAGWDRGPEHVLFLMSEHQAQRRCVALTAHSGAISRRALHYGGPASPGQQGPACRQPHAYPIRAGPGRSPTRIPSHPRSSRVPAPGTRAGPVERIQRRNAQRRVFRRRRERHASGPTAFPSTPVFTPTAGAAPAPVGSPASATGTIQPRHEGDEPDAARRQARKASPRAQARASPPRYQTEREGVEQPECDHERLLEALVERRRKRRTP